MLARIDDGETVRLACDLIRIPSFTTEETACAEWLASYLAEPGARGGAAGDRAGTQADHRPASRHAAAAESIMLNGHIDIDPLASGWTRDPFDPWIADGKLFGHGVYNMKGGVAACIMADAGDPAIGRARSAATWSWPAWRPSSTAVWARVHAIEHGARTDMAVVAEPYGAYTILTKHTGTMDVVVHTLGRATHISKKEQGVDAIAQHDAGHRRALRDAFHARARSRSARAPAA